MAREFIEKDRQIYIDFAKEFYSGGGVLHEVSVECFNKTFDAIIAKSPFVQGYMLEYNGAPAGYCVTAKGFSTEIGGNTLWVEDIFVKPEFQGKGIAKTFLKELIENTDSSVCRVRLEATKDNDGAIGLYSKLGFEELKYNQYILDK